MKIAFDAKRAYQNATGLGNYSRTLISSLANFYPQHQYYLCAPKLTERFSTTSFSNIHNITPRSFPSSAFKSAWRSNWVKKDLVRNKVGLYHGLSHEIPLGINSTGIRAVVTIHDLIFERYPVQYNKLDVQIYRSKFKYACRHADKVVAISRQTKEDIIQFYRIPEEKIEICYQSCSPAFESEVSDLEKKRVKELYDLPDKFFLYVGSVIERKNLLNICRALQQLKNTLNVPLVVIGEGGRYKQEVEQYLAENNLQQHVIFLLDSLVVRSRQAFQTLQSGADFPAIYQQALCMIYPSVFEGFGIPVLEALWSGLPVITSNVSCMPETGGDAACYVDPYSVKEIAEAMLEVLTNDALRRQMREKGRQHAKNFTREKCAANIMDVYLRLQ